MKPSQQDIAQGLTPGTVIDGRYRVVRCIGQGGNGLVHEVEHLFTGRRLAVKSLFDETGAARLEQEARATSLLRNLHAAKITDMGPNGPAGPYLVMELLEGQSLRALLDEVGQVPLELTANIALQVCECVAEAHLHGIVHRDLKPENVFLCGSPWPGQYDVRVLDFGVVKIEKDGPIPNSSLTRTGSTVGTPYYMSLEQLRNSSAVDHRADIYSLGVVLYESLSGKKPFTAETIGDLVFALCSGPPTHLSRIRPDLPPELAELVMRTLSINREQRPASMTELANALLPFANPAFGLWIKIDGKQPAVSHKASFGPTNVSTPPASIKRQVTVVPRPELEAPSNEGAPQSRAPHAGGPKTRPLAEVKELAGEGAPVSRAPMTTPMPVPQKTPPPAPQKTPLSTSAKPSSPLPGVVVSPPPTSRGSIGLGAAGPAGTAASAALPSHPLAETELDARWSKPPAQDSEPELDTGATRSRDTPTEMYQKEEHEEVTQGDRDTPTKALSVNDVPPEPTAPRPFVHTQPTQAVAMDAPPAAPRFGSPQGLPFQPVESPSGVGYVPREAPQRMPVATMQLAPSGSSAARAGWKTSLDGALVGVGGFLENAVKRLRQAPRNTQIIILGGAGLLFLLLFIGTLVGLLRR